MRLILSLLVFAGCDRRLGVRKPSAATTKEPPKLKLLFLGDNAGHKPAERFKILQPVLRRARNIELTYTDKLDDLNAETLAKYDGLMIYANHDRGSARSRRRRCSTYVAGGKGFVPLHCASYCFLNSPKYIALVGAQFRSHGTGTFRTEVVKPDHPIMKGYQPFHQLGRDLRPHQAQREGPHRPGSSRRGRREGTVDVGAHARARAASSTPPGATTAAPGATPASRTCSNAASAGPAARTRHLAGVVRR